MIWKDSPVYPFNCGCLAESAVVKPKPLRGRFQSGSKQEPWHCCLWKSMNPNSHLALQTALLDQRKMGSRFLLAQLFVPFLVSCCCSHATGFGGPQGHPQVLWLSIQLCPLPGFSTVKGRMAQLATVKGSRGEDWWKPGSSFKGSLPPHGMHLITAAAGCDNTCEMLPTREALIEPTTQGYCWELVVSAASASHLPKSQTPRRKTGVRQKAYCLYKQFRHDESFLLIYIYI